MSRTAKVFMTIGEVLKSLREEFPEVSISKIRFLESEGLIEPERTASGYRKFGDRDLARLRYILRLQRDHFMPLKVIRKRLEHFDPSEPHPAGIGGNGPAEAPSPPRLQPEEEDLPLATAGLSLTFDELVSASGLSADEVQELEAYGLIDSHSAGDGVRYDEDDLMIAKIARDFGKYGIEPRHMKMYRNFAERESGLFEQIVLPRSAAAEGRRQVAQSVIELAKLSKRLKQLLLKASLRQLLHG